MNAPSPLLERASSLLFWLLLAAVAWFLLRGHNAPGGGFVAGLAAVAATSALALAQGPGAARRRLPLAPGYLAAGGVLLALAAGLPALALGLPYLTHLWVSVDLLLFQLPLSTVLLFDLGVLLTVWGSLAGFILGLLPEEAHQP